MIKNKEIKMLEETIEEQKKAIERLKCQLNTSHEITKKIQEEKSKYVKELQELRGLDIIYKAKSLMTQKGREAIEKELQEANKEIDRLKEKIKEYKLAVPTPNKFKWGNNETEYKTHSLTYFLGETCEKWKKESHKKKNNITITIKIKKDENNN